MAFSIGASNFSIGASGQGEGAFNGSMSGTLAGVGSATGDLTFSLAGTLAGAGTLSGVITGLASLSGTLAGVGTLAGGVTILAWRPFAMENTDVGFTNITITGDIMATPLTGERLVATDITKQLVSSDLSDWVTGTSNRVTVTNDADGTITLSSPQDIHTGASPIFAGLTLSGLIAAGIVKNSAAGLLSTATSLSLTTEVSGILPIANGGTNASSFASNSGVSYFNGTRIVNSANLTFDGTDFACTGNGRFSGNIYLANDKRTYWGDGNDSSMYWDYTGSLMNLNSNGKLGIYANSGYMTLNATTDMYIDFGGTSYWRDMDDSDAVRMSLNSATGDLTVDGNMLADGGMYADGDMHAEGNMYAGGDMHVDDDMWLGGNMYADNMLADGIMYAGGDMYAGGFLDVEGYLAVGCFDKVTISHDETNGAMTWDDGDLYFKTNEGTNTQSTVRILGKGTGNSALWIYHDGSTYYTRLYRYSSGVGAIEVNGELALQPDSYGNTSMFRGSASNKTPELKLYGYRTGDSLRSLEIGVGVDAADTASFDGVSNYLFNGAVDAVAGFKDNGTAGIDTTFLDADGNTITVSGGIITAKTAP